MPVPELWILAGPNGAGKSTAVQRSSISKNVLGVGFINPDDRTLHKLLAAGYSGFADTPHRILYELFIESANEVSKELEEKIEAGEPIGVETVLSSEKYRPLVETIRTRMGFFGLIYIAVSSPEISKARVAARVRRFGHGVPEDKITLRWHRSLDCLGWFAERANDFWVFDNSDSNPAIAPKLLSSGKNGRLEFLASDAFPEMKAALASLPTPPLK